MQAHVNRAPRIVIPPYHGLPTVLSAVASAIGFFIFVALVLERLTHGAAGSGLLNAPWYIAVIGIFSSGNMGMTLASYVNNRPRLELTSEGIDVFRGVWRKEFWRWNQLGQFYHSSPPSVVESRLIDTDSGILALDASKYRAGESLAQTLNRYRDSRV